MAEILEAGIAVVSNAIYGSQGVESGNSLEENTAPADIDKARAFRESRMIRQEKDGIYIQASVCNTSLKELGAYGIGLELYFLTLKQLGIIFFIISLISAWPMAENYYGGGLSEGDKKQAWDTLTLGNQVNYPLTMSISAAESQVTSLDNSKIRLIIADLLYTLCFAFFIVFFQITSSHKIKSNASKNSACDDFSVEVVGFPCEAIQPSEVIDFFRNNIGEVVEVYLARKYNGVLSSYKTRAELVLEHQYYVRLAKNRIDTTKKQRKIQKKIDLFDKKIAESERTSNMSHDELPVIKAFVIFQTVEDKLKCLKEFRTANSCCTRYAKKLKFRGIYKLEASNTSEPSNINWENLEISCCERFMRQIVAIILACVILIISIVIIYLLRSVDDGLPSDSDCILNYHVDSSKTLTEAQSIYTSDNEKYCYCKDSSIETIISDSSLRDFCTYYIEQRSYSISVRVGVCIGVVMINFFIKIIFKIISKFEKSASRSKEQVTVMRKVFLAMFTNTALVVLAVNANFSSLQFIKYLPFNQYIFNSVFEDFTRKWYVEVGSTITLTMIISVFSPHAMNFLFFYPRGGCKRNCCNKGYKTQREINTAFQGPEFDIATRYSQVLNVIFTSLLYSGGIPLLNATCCGTMFILYWTDKFLILRHYSKPPRYSDDLNRAFISLLPFAAVFHCGFSLYMLGSESIFPETFYTQGGYLYAHSNDIYDRVISVCGLIFLGVIAVSLGVYLSVKSVSWLNDPLDDAPTRVVPEGENVPQRSFSQELANIKEHGLTSYDIHSNPVYSDLIVNLDNAAQAVKGFSKVNQQRTIHDSRDFLQDLKT